MLAYKPGAPTTFDPPLTFASLIIATAGAAGGFAIAAGGFARGAPLIGGALVGLSIAAMHYTGMLAYRAQGLITWDCRFVAASIALAIAFASAALHFAVRRAGRADKVKAVGFLVLAIAGLHFTGMASLHISVLAIDDSQFSRGTPQLLAMTVAGVSILVMSLGVVSSLIDDEARSDADRRVEDSARRDTLTGLPNRAGLDDPLRRELEKARSLGVRLALILIDLDQFKELNDLHGQSVGDAVLRTCARRMREAAGAETLIARVGADEFAAVHRIASQADLNAFLAELHGAIVKRMGKDDLVLHVDASMGVALYPDHAGTKEVLFQNAELALYRARSERGAGICIYDPSMDELVRGRRKLVSELRAAIESEQLQVYYQVQQSVATGEIRGYEALVRWEHPYRGFIPPSEFIPLAEENGLIASLGEWVLRRACADAASSLRPHRVAVNLSPLQFTHTDLPALTRAVLAGTGLPAERLELELTESTIIADKARCLETLRRIKAIGVTIAIDDFGTGYSSLDTLRSFPFDKIKLDRSFMSEIETSPQALAILRAVLALGKSLGVLVLAEGIETPGQLALLRAEGCDEAQGYLLGRPAPLQAITAAPAETKATRNWSISRSGSRSRSRDSRPAAGSIAAGK
jgi:diguanylate cyclase (GGDEF)-like protein